jgi:hypothetical protein
MFHGEVAGDVIPPRRVVAVTAGTLVRLPQVHRRLGMSHYHHLLNLDIPKVICIIYGRWMRL